MEVVILCGGRGTRMGYDELPKALFLIGDKPILWHIMNIYSYYGFKNFVLCLGYNGNKIREYFLNTKEWDVKFCDTGLDTNTGGRIKRIKDYIKTEHFFVTYGDGLADINLKKLLSFHKAHNKTATLAAVKPSSPFGIVDIDKRTNLVTNFEEKPIVDHWINGGFFVFNKDIFKYMEENDVLEKDTFSRVVKDEELCAYKHAGFWECMDTYKDNLRLNLLMKKGEAPWVVWKGEKNG